jgi:hypothetical protein
MNEDRRELSTADLAAREKAPDLPATDRRDVRVPPAARSPEPRTGPPPAPASASPHQDTGDGHREMLFPHDEVERLRVQWTDVQSAFVDAPRNAVERADALVAQAMKRMAETFARERSTLEQQWDRGDNVTTEDLRVALQRYRAFFDRLLSV